MSEWQEEGGLGGGSEGGSDREWETGSGEEEIDEQGRNPTQRRMDEEGTSGAPVEENEPSPHEGEEGQEAV
jgi:hypothetical protein